MKEYTQLKKQKELIEKHIGFLKQQYMDALLTDIELDREMSEAMMALKKINKQINS